MRALYQRDCRYNSRGQSVQFAPPGAAPAVANGESGPEAVSRGGSDALAGAEARTAVRVQFCGC